MIDRRDRGIEAAIAAELASGKTPAELVRSGTYVKSTVYKVASGRYRGVDSEVRAMERISALLSTLPPEARQRVLEWVWRRWSQPPR